MSPAGKTAERPKRYLRQWELIERVRAYDPTADEAVLDRAYVYAMKMHGAQLRASGDPYFAHPIEVAGILTEYRMDTATIVTALLHDIIEDTPVSRAELAKTFGDEVGELVEGVTKLSKLEFSVESKRQGENLRKFILAISRDVRVLMVKLADRLHNMRTLHFIKSAAKRERIARETLDIYAPLARSIGVHRITSELEELAFEHLQPAARAAIVRRLNSLRAEQGDALSELSQDIAASLEEAGIVASVYGREKKPYSIWRKLQNKSVGFSNIGDIYAFRVIVEAEDGLLSGARRRPSDVAERAEPLQGLHLHAQAEQLPLASHHCGGPARHARRAPDPHRSDGPRGGGGGRGALALQDRRLRLRPRGGQAAQGGVDPLQNLRHLVQVLEHGGDAEDLVEHAKLEMFLDQVFVFTPKGRLVTLPQGAMPLDFAYAVHTDVGDTAVGVKINGEIRPLRTPLQNGDVVEVVRGKTRNTPPDWRSLTVTGRARSAIRRHIRSVEREEFTRLGRSAVEHAFARAGKTMEGLSLRPALERFVAGGRRTNCSTWWDAAASRPPPCSVRSSQA